MGNPTKKIWVFPLQIHRRILPLITLVWMSRGSSPSKYRLFGNGRNFKGEPHTKIYKKKVTIHKLQMVINGTIFFDKCLNKIKKNNVLRFTPIVNHVSQRWHLLVPMTKSKQRGGISWVMYLTTHSHGHIWSMSLSKYGHKMSVSFSTLCLKGWRFLTSKLIGLSGVTSY